MQARAWGRNTRGGPSLAEKEASIDRTVKVRTDAALACVLLAAAAAAGLALVFAETLLLIIIIIIVGFPVVPSDRREDPSLAGAGRGSLGHDLGQVGGGRNECQLPYPSDRLRVLSREQEEPLPRALLCSLAVL